MRSIFISLTMLLQLVIISRSEAQFRVLSTLVNEAKEPVPIANVMLLNPKDSSLVDGAISDGKGVFSLSTIPEGRYILAVKIIGFTTNHQEIQVSENLQIPTIKLNDRTEDLDEVLIVANGPTSALS